MGGFALPALGKAQEAAILAMRDVKPFGARPFNRFYMLHGTLTDTAITTTSSTTYTSLTRPFAASENIKFSLQSTNNGVMTAFYSLDGVTFTSKVITPTQDPVSSKYVYELSVPGPVINAYYKYVETAAVGAIFGGISSLESVV